MEPRTVKNELWRIAQPYPTLRGILCSKLPSGGTVGAVWAEKLKDLHPDHFSNVCDEYADGDRELPNPVDRLWYEIRRECLDRSDRDRKRWEAHQRHLEGLRNIEERKAKKGQPAKLIEPPAKSKGVCGTPLRLKELVQTIIEASDEKRA